MEKQSAPSRKHGTGAAAAGNESQARAGEVDWAVFRGPAAVERRDASSRKHGAGAAAADNESQPRLDDAAAYGGARAAASLDRRARNFWNGTTSDDLYAAMEEQRKFVVNSHSGQVVCESRARGRQNEHHDQH